MFRFRCLFIAASFVCAAHSLLQAQAIERDEAKVAKPASTLRLVQNYELPSLKGVVGMAISSDGRFLYAPGYETATMHVFSVEPQSGRLELVEAEKLTNCLEGATDFCLSSDGKLGLASAFRSKSVTLFQRNSESGRMSKLQTIASQTEKLKGFQWPIRGVFSTDGKFAYVIDSGISPSIFVKKAPAVLVFKIADDKIEFVESFDGAGIALANCRGIVLHPNGKHILVTASDGKSLILLGRNETSGKLDLIETISEPSKALEGGMSVLVDPTGKFVYTLSGRFRGTGGLAVFAFDETKPSLTFVESHLSGSDGLQQFKGGNQLALSPNGLSVYAIGTTSGTVSVFKRDNATGKLTAVETVAVRPQWKDSVAGVVVSPDSRFVYVSGAERDPSITVLEATH